jgi:transposase InsO family protein
MSIDDAYTKIDARRDEYNSERPHSALGYRTPHEFIEDNQPEIKPAV